jgi:hypothetical protein
MCAVHPRGGLITGCFGFGFGCGFGFGFGFGFGLGCGFGGMDPFVVTKDDLFLPPHASFGYENL